MAISSQNHVTLPSQRDTGILSPGHKPAMQRLPSQSDPSLRRKLSRCRHTIADETDSAKSHTVIR
jgi:hypothetical protein